jgi:hypothetical protein
LGPLPEDHTNPLRQLLALAMRHPTQDLDAASCRDQDARQHFDGRRLARAVRSDTADHLATLDSERDVTHRVYQT